MRGRGTTLGFGVFVTETLKRPQLLLFVWKYGVFVKVMLGSVTNKPQVPVA